MRTWISYLLERIRGSLWFVPGLMSLAAAGLALLSASYDDEVARAGARYAFLYRGDPEAARTLLSTVAGSMITVAGVSFSVTMVALSLTSSQFGPRLLVNFMRDRGNQVVLGAFIGTFLFCLIALGSTAGRSDTYVSVSASVGLLLAAVSLGLLIFFIHHVASSMQADVVIDDVAGELSQSMGRQFPAAKLDGLRPDPARGDFPESARQVASTRSGYVQSVDHPRLLRLASEHGVRLRVLRRPGHFVIEKAPLVAVAEAPGADGDGLDEGLTSSIQGAFILGGWRTADQDPEYGVHQLVEIAVRALSPGINDPFTAMTCVDRLAGVLGEIADRPARPPVLTDDDGGVRVYLDPVDFPGVLDAAFDQIRQCATAMPAVSIRLLEALTRIAGVTADPARREALRAQARLIVDGCGNGWVSRDREALEERYRSFESQLSA